MSYVLPRVRNIADAAPGWWASPRAVYIGRNESLARDCGMEAPIWANPYRVPTNGNRLQVIAKYERSLRNRLTIDAGGQMALMLALAASGVLPRMVQRALMGAQLRSAILALSNRDLFCHCAPKPCHGDAIVRVFSDLVLVEESRRT